MDDVTSKAGIDQSNERDFKFYQSAKTPYVIIAVRVRVLNNIKFC